MSSTAQHAQGPELHQQPLKEITETRNTKIPFNHVKGTGQQFKLTLNNPGLLKNKGLYDSSDNPLPAALATTIPLSSHEPQHS